MDLKQYVGMRVKAARVRRGLTQERLAELVERTAESVSNIERGVVLPPLDTLFSLAQHLDVAMCHFFEDLDQSRPVARHRLDLEQKLQWLGAELTDENLRLAIAMVETIKAQRPE